LPETQEDAPAVAAEKPHKKLPTHRIARKDHATQEHRVAHSVKRGRAVPTLHVGRSSAELVGTTSDGRWILFVADSGQRIIVPPPPGYGD
jgi:hypothetical protein